MPAEAVAEVAPPPPITRAPLLPPGLRGLANVRGRVVPVLALHRLLGEAPSEAIGHLVIIDGESPIGLQVDRLLGLEAPPGAPGADGDASWLDLAALTARVLEDAPARGSGRERAVATPAASTAIRAEEAFLRFVAAGQAFGLPLDEAREVLRVPSDIARLPAADAAMIGATAVRGQVLPVVSLRVLLGFSPAPVTLASRLVLVAIGDGAIALLVDEVIDVLRVPPRNISPVPELLNRGGGETRIVRLIRGPSGLVSVLAAAQLFDEPTTAALSAQSLGDVPSEAVVGEVETAPFVRFRLGAEVYALPVEAVVEIVPAPTNPAPPPNAPDFLLGLMNYRGGVVPLIDQGRRFGASRSRPAAPVVVVIRVGELAAGLLVDAVERVIEIPLSALTRSSGMVSGDAKVFDRVSTAGGGNDLLLIADPRELLDQAERDILVGVMARAEAAAA